MQRASSDTHCPMVDVLVAVRDEAQMIGAKLRELDAIAYPADRLRLVIVDGGSSDGTVAAITAHTADDDRWLPLFTSLASKPAQLNEGLLRTAAPWILVTDADARVPPDTLPRLLAAVAHDPRIGVVGTTVLPHNAHPLDVWHWRASNWIRRVEQRVTGSAGLVVAPCYLFRRDLLDRFPDDAIADDVHVVCRAAMKGIRTALIDTGVTELRAATSTTAWFRHKLRRTLAYLREIFRFAPGLMRMGRPMRTVLLCRTLSLTVVPVAGVAAAPFVASMPGLPWAFAAMVLLAGGAGLRSTRSRRGGIADGLLAIGLPLWIFGIAVAALVLYPFVRQSPCYARPARRAEESEACS